MDHFALLEFIRSHRWAIEATASLDHTPQAAIIGFAATEKFELAFDTLASSRKATNLRANPHIAFVIGGWNNNEPRTVQYEGIADFPTGIELEQLKKMYFTVFSDGPTRVSWPGLTYVRVRPCWVRYSNFSFEPPSIVEYSFEE